MPATSRSKPVRGLSPLALLVDNFLNSHLPSKNPRLLVACSGGPDSVALLHALGEISKLRKIQVEVGHVNHRLRGKESDGDQHFVERLAHSKGWRVFVFRLPVAGGGNLEERARDLRYEALCAHAKRRRLDAVLVAHTLDDQAETILMNLFRGTGPEGLTGMRPIRADGDTKMLIGRPLLGAKRADVRAYAKRMGGFRTDRTNLDTQYFRNYIRISLFPQLQDRIPGFEQRVVRFANLLRDDLPLLEQLSTQAADRVGRVHRGGWLLDWRKFSQEPVALQRRVLRKAAGRDLLTFDGVEGLRSWMASPPKSARVWQLKKGWIVERLSKSKGSPSPALFWFRQMPSPVVRKDSRNKKGR